MKFMSTLSGPDRHLVITMSDKHIMKAYCRKLCIFVVVIIVLYCTWTLSSARLPQNKSRASTGMNANPPKKLQVENSGATKKRKSAHKIEKSLSRNNIIKMGHGKKTLNNDIKKSLLKGNSDNVDTKKRLPNVIIGGVKKCGTGPLRTFLSVHPSVVVNELEVHYFDRHYSEGLSWYVNQMPESSKDQLTIEKTPRYFVEPDVPRQVYEDVSPQTKLIFVACEPVHRSMSDFLHTLKHKTKALKVIKSTSRDSIAFIKEKERLERYKHEHYNISDTFEMTVLDNHWNVNENSGIIQTGCYDVYLSNWLKYFPLTQIHIVDGEAFKTHPAGELIKIEKFLNIQPYFSTDLFYFDKEKGFFCLAKPYQYCLGKNKGREHPVIDNKTLTILADYYKSHNKKFSQMLGQQFSWINLK